MTDYRTVRGIGAALVLTAMGIADAVAQSAGTAVAAAPAVERYRLIEVAGSALPAEVEKEWSCTEYVTRGTLTLSADSLWRLRAAIREDCGDRAEVDTEEEGGRYSRAGATIRFHHDDENDDRDWKLRQDIDLDDLETGTLAADGTLTVRLEDGKTTLVFRE